MWLFLSSIKCFDYETREKYFWIDSSPRGFRALKCGLTFNYIINNLKFTIMKLLMTVQPKNGAKSSDPVIVDTDKNDLSCLFINSLRSGDNVLIFQPVAEYTADPCGECSNKE